MTQRRRLLHAMHSAGLRLDDAGVAADVAMRTLREQRDLLIVAARDAGLSYRQIGRAVQLDHARVIRVVTAAAVKTPLDEGIV